MIADGSQMESPDTLGTEVPDPFELKGDTKDSEFDPNKDGKLEAWISPDASDNNVIDATDRFASTDTAVPENETPADVINLDSLEKEVKSEKRETTELTTDLAEIKRETLAKLEKAETEALAEEEKITKMESEAIKLSDTIRERKEVVARKLEYIRRMKGALSQSEDTPEQLAA